MDYYQKHRFDIYITVNSPSKFQANAAAYPSGIRQFCSFCCIQTKYPGENENIKELMTHFQGKMAVMIIKNGWNC